MLFDWLKTVTSSSNFFNKLAHFNQSENQITVMSDLFFCEGFSLVYIIITTIIRVISKVHFRKHVITATIIIKLLARMSVTISYLPTD